jgi:hypothetical protein
MTIPRVFPAGNDSRNLIAIDISLVGSYSIGCKSAKHETRCNEQPDSSVTGRNAHHLGLLVMRRDALNDLRAHSLSSAPGSKTLGSGTAVGKYFPIAVRVRQFWAHTPSGMFAGRPFARGQNHVASSVGWMPVRQCEVRDQRRCVHGCLLSLLHVSSSARFGFSSSFFGMGTGLSMGSGQ